MNSTQAVDKVNSMHGVLTDTCGVLAPGKVIKRTVAPPPAQGLLFHEQWWLSAATGGNYREATVTSDGKVVARLPYVIRRNRGFTSLRMPYFTHLLGPVVDAGPGKPQTQLVRRLSLVRELIDQLPRFDFFKMILEHGPAGLAFQERGFTLTPQYNFRIDSQPDAETVWKEMNFKLRQHIRRAEEKFTVVSLDQPEEFIAFYESTLKSDGQANLYDFATFADLFREARKRGAGEILCVSWPDGRPAAMAFIAWDRRTTYYLLSRRAGQEGDNGSVPLLLWEAIKGALARGQNFDFDGVSTSGTARFYANFGGRLEMRLIARRSTPLFEAATRAKHWLTRGTGEETRNFT